jgi:hypothetical protein
MNEYPWTKENDVADTVTADQIDWALNRLAVAIMKAGAEGTRL